MLPFNVFCCIGFVDTKMVKPALSWEVSNKGTVSMNTKLTIYLSKEQFALTSDPTAAHSLSVHIDFM